jgi:hypothetical protein
VWVEILLIAPSVERKRSAVAPNALLPLLRARGLARPARDDRGRARLRRAIRFVDRLFPSGPNCYRRALLEIAMDAGAAREPLHMGLNAEGGPRSGHAWLASSPDRPAHYDAEFVV